MSQLLLNEQPLIVLPKLASKIGLNEAIVVQQIHYWNQINKKSGNNFHDGYHWTYSTYKQWGEQFPFWCEKTIKTIFTRLENSGLVISDNYNKLKIDRTKWYRLNYGAIESLESSALCKCYPIKGKDLPDHSAIFTQAIPKTYTENTSETTPIKNSPIKSAFTPSGEECGSSRFEIQLRDNIFEFFTNKYKDCYGTDHPYYKKELKDKCFASLLPAITDEEHACGMIADFFESVSDINEHGEHRNKTLSLFCSEGFLDILIARSC